MFNSHIFDYVFAYQILKNLQHIEIFLCEIIIFFLYVYFYRTSTCIRLNFHSPLSQSYHMFLAVLSSFSLFINFMYISVFSILIHIAYLSWKKLSMNN